VTGPAVRRQGRRLGRGRQVGGDGGVVGPQDEDTRGRQSCGTVTRYPYCATSREIRGPNLLVLI
jgi:hypothetical protein